MKNPVIVDWKIQKIQQGSVKFYEGLTSENIVLSQYPLLYPTLDITGPVLEYMYADREFEVERPTFTNSLIKAGSVKYYEAESLEWEFKARATEKVVSLQKMTTSPTPGMNNAEYPVYLSSGKYKESDVIYPLIGHKHQGVVMRKEMDGTGWIYYLRLSKYNDEEFFPPALLAPNLEWGKIDAVQGEYTSEYGSSDINLGLAKLKFFTHMTTAGKSIAFTDKGAGIKLKMIAKDEKGSDIAAMPNMILDEREAKFVAENNWEREKRVVIGRGADDSIMDNSSKFHRRIGPGVFQFMEKASLQGYPMYGNYNLENFVKDIVGPTNYFSNPTPSVYNIWTGMGGTKLSRDWMKTYFGKLGVLPNEMHFEKMAGDEGPAQAIRIKSHYFAEFDFFPYGTFRFHNMPLFDNPEVFGGSRDPETGHLYSSFTFMVENKGTIGDNIELVERKNFEVYSYICGTFGPAGAIKSGGSTGGYTSSNRKAGFELVHSRVHGVRVKDISATTLLQPNIKLY